MPNHTNSTFSQTNESIIANNKLLFRPTTHVLFALLCAIPNTSKLTAHLYYLAPFVSPLPPLPISSLSAHPLWLISYNGQQTSLLENITKAPIANKSARKYAPY